MKTLIALFVFLAFAGAADWLNQGGDAQHSGWQKDEKQLTVANVHGLKQLWKRPLDSALTAPAMLGPIITHRGIKELVFIAAASDTVYAVDADLGRVFWKRHFESSPVPSCASGLTATPAIAPSTNADPNAEWSSPLRPIYVVTSDGALHTIRASDGEDMGPPTKFLPPGAKASNLAVSGDSLIAQTAAGCGDAGGAGWTMKIASGAVSRAQAPQDTGLQASTRDWRFAATPAGLSAFQGGRLRWSVPNVQTSFAPAVANGIVFVLRGAALYAVDATTGQQLYASGVLPGPTSGLAIANGHICFSAADNALYCFGIPFEI